ncbi:type VII secretion system-associated protein [Streptomyces scabiei]|uniref:type VII secretion system-associated protein n=1 Tax=Streptomyces scabiei TaxID=1930 RepID=UPI0036743266
MTDEIRAQAAAQPDGWVYAIDAYFDPNGEVPPYGVVGAWKVDSQGQLTGEFTKNPDYRPSPRALGMTKPTDAVDAAIQLAAVGYGSEADLRRALLDAVVYVARDAQHVSPIAIHTSSSQASHSARELRQTAFRALLPELPEDAVLRLNPGGSASVDIPVADLRGAM